MQQVMKTIRVYGWIKEHEKKEQDMNNLAAENIEEVQKSREIFAGAREDSIHIRSIFVLWNTLLDRSRTEHHIKLLKTGQQYVCYVFH